MNENDVLHKKMVNELHKKAMEFAYLATKKRDENHENESIAFSKQAFDYESAAAMMMYNTDIEHTRSVLFRSAGWLAFNSGDAKMAQNMVNFGKAGKPHPEIRFELDELQTAINEKLNLPNIIDIIPWFAKEYVNSDNENICKKYTNTNLINVAS